VITVAGDQAVGIVNGAVIVETVFGFPDRQAEMAQ